MSHRYERRHGAIRDWGPPRPMTFFALLSTEAHATCGQVRCPHCGAWPGAACVTDKNREAWTPHMRRVRARLDQLKGTDQ